MDKKVLYDRLVAAQIYAPIVFKFHYMHAVGKRLQQSEKAGTILQEMFGQAKIMKVEITGDKFTWIIAKTQLFTPEDAEVFASGFSEILESFELRVVPEFCISLVSSEDKIWSIKLAGGNKLLRSMFQGVCSNMCKRFAYPIHVGPVSDSNGILSISIECDDEDNILALAEMLAVSFGKELLL